MKKRTAIFSLKEDSRCEFLHIEDGKIVALVLSGMPPYPIISGAVSDFTLPNGDKITPEHFISEDVPPPPRTPGQSDEEYYDSDAYYNWRNRDSNEESIRDDLIDSIFSPGTAEMLKRGA